MYGIIQSRSAWRGPQLASECDWIHEFTPAEVQEVDDALTAAKSKGRALDSLTKQDFPLPTVAKRLAIARDFLEDGKGIYQLRGLRVEGRSKDDLRLLYWGLGLHLGTAVSQSKDGDILGDVRNVGVDIRSPQGRGYKSNQRLNFHTDSADVVGLFVLRTAMQGGQSKVVSSVSAHNEIARLRPDLLEVLYHPFYWSWNQQEPAGAPPYYQQPIFTLQWQVFLPLHSRAHQQCATVSGSAAPDGRADCCARSPGPGHQRRKPARGLRLPAGRRPASQQSYLPACAYGV